MEIRELNSSSISRHLWEHLSHPQSSQYVALLQKNVLVLDTYVSKNFSVRKRKEPILIRILGLKFVGAKSQIEID